MIAPQMYILLGHFTRNTILICVSPAKYLSNGNSKNRNSVKGMICNQYPPPQSGRYYAFIRLRKLSLSLQQERSITVFYKVPRLIVKLFVSIFHNCIVFGWVKQTLASFIVVTIIYQIKVRSIAWNETPLPKR